ncbi:MAG: hypothetical protein M1813_007790 [Trichoglossum hirsutum]|nr:MAG: hypothetical protein M1813_007790 [Trichoglossum hirsutum]
MDKVYNYAYFTIVSLMSSSQSSFLKPDVPQISIPFQSRFAEAEQTRPGVTRGWTFQEQVLSLRTFMFGLAGITFVCLSASETTSAKENPPRSFLHTIHKISVQEAASVEGYEKWRDFARDFSGRGFTNQNDRLPALAGLANLFARKLGIYGQYAAGIWREDLINGLLWRFLSKAPWHKHLPELLEQLNDPSDYIGPSWSWIDRFCITFFYWDDAVDDWSAWTQQFRLLQPERAFKKEHGQLKKDDDVCLMLLTKIWTLIVDFDFFFNGYSTELELKDHESLRHAGGIKCSEMSCSWSRIGFKTSAALKRHMREYHSTLENVKKPRTVRRKHVGGDSNQEPLLDSNKPVDFLMSNDSQFHMDFGPLDGGDVLEQFDFDSFLNTDDNSATGAFAFPPVFPPEVPEGGK